MALPLVNRLLSEPLLSHLNAKRKFPVEFALLRGRAEPTSQQPSILHFSVNKAATQYTKAVLCRCAAENGLVHANFSDLAFNSSVPYLDNLSGPEMAAYAHVFKPRGYIYSVFGSVVDGIPDFRRYRTVLTVRDPRDVLVSEFFSIAFSHKEPRNRDKQARFRARRREARQMDLDSYVVHASRRVTRIYQEYAALRSQGQHVLVANYEEMIADFRSWLDRILTFCDLTVSPSLRTELCAEAAASTPQDENIQRHLRQRTPGDYRRKLRPTTVARLNRELAPILSAFGYR